jgi:ADP-ribose pyrophosphatase
MPGTLRRGGEETLLRTPWFEVVLRDGYHVIREPQAVNGVVVIPVLPDGRLLLASLERKPIQAVSVEFPRGAIDQGEPVLAAAERELLEETGWEPGAVELLGYVHSNTGLLASSAAVCMATLSAQTRSVTDGEVSALHEVTQAELLEMIQRGEITDGHTLSAMMLMLASHAQSSRCSSCGAQQDSLLR